MACGLAAGCGGEHDRLMKEKYSSYPAIIKHAIDRGYPIAGMDYDQVYLALGEPVCKKTIEPKGRPVEVWLFPPGGRDPCTTPNFRVYFENGLVTGWQDLRSVPLVLTPNPASPGKEPTAKEGGHGEN
jgi:outer membrane protein assembly factor BamE